MPRKQIAVKWKNENKGEYFTTADTLHEMQPSVNVAYSPFLVRSGPAELTINADTAIKIIANGKHKVFTDRVDLKIPLLDALDTGSTMLPGKDYYVYFVDTGDYAEVVVSLASTFPQGATAENSRKIGGFHTLCADVGGIPTHPLSGYTSGSVLPNSVWCLTHRPRSAPEGMVYDAMDGIWADIYLASVAAGKLVSVYKGVIADGTSNPAFHWYKFDQWLRAVKKRMPSQGEFVSLSLGANQGTNIAGSSDPGTTGGHTDTAGRRMISNIGCEDTCGVLWQWGIESGAGGAGSWANAYSGLDGGVAGQHYLAPNRPRLGGNWASGASCGSRGSYWYNGPLSVRADFGVRGVTEPWAG